MVDTITMDIPEWAKDKHIFIFAGSELLAKKEVRVIRQDGKLVTVRQPLMIKSEDGRCDGCGICCEDAGFSQKMLDEMKERLNNPSDDACPFLGENGCILGNWIPFSCAKSLCTHYEGCSEYMKVV